jgi:multiple sugar transport system substrate-binding protein
VVGRRLKALASSALFCALVAGCTAAEPAPKTASPPASPSTSTPAEPVTLTLGVWGPKPMIEAYRSLGDAFTEEHPDVTVEVQPHRDAEDLVSSVEGGDAPDVFLLDHDHLAGFVKDRRVQPVDRLLEARNVDFGDGYQRGGLTAFAANASLQCMPQDVSPVVVYYNKELVELKKLGREGEEPPSAVDGWTWDMFSAAARQASRGRAKGVYIDPSLSGIAPFVWSAGGDIVDDTQSPTTLTLADGDSRAALEQVLELARDPQLTPTSRELEKQGALDRFENGRLGMILGSRALTPALRKVDGLRFDVMPLPSLGRLRTIADMTGYCISSETDHVDAAADLVAFAAGRKGATFTARTGYVVPSNLEVANSSAFAQTSRQPASSFLFNEGVRRAQTMPYAAAWPDVEDRVRGALKRMFYAPVIDLDALTEEIDTSSRKVLAPEER